MKRKWIWIVLVLIIALGLYLKKTFTVYYEKRGEISFYNDGRIELKIMRVFENLPLHFVGEVNHVLCKSARTGDFPARKFLGGAEAEWNEIPVSFLIYDESGRGASLEAYAEAAKKHYRVQEGVLIIFTGSGIYFSLDDCRSVVGWEVTRDLPKEIPVASTAESEKCEKQQKDNTAKGLANYGDCRYFSFKGNNQPLFDEIKASGSEIKFQMRANSLKGPIRVESKDAGRTWSLSGPQASE